MSTSAVISDNTGRLHTLLINLIPFVLLYALSSKTLFSIEPAPINPPPIARFEGHDPLAHPKGMPPSVAFNCSLCHSIPSPKSLPRSIWPLQLKNMKTIMESHRIHVTDQDLQVWLDYYLKHSDDQLEELPYFKPSQSGYWERSQIGQKPIVNLKMPPSQRNRPPIITSLEPVDLFNSGNTGLLVCDGHRKTLSYINLEKSLLKETLIANLPIPVRTKVYDHNGDGRLDIAVACIGKFEKPDDSRVGSAYILIQNKDGTFETNQLVDRFPRIADIQPIDMDQDGDLDHLMAVYGWRYSGQLAWMENLGGNKMNLHPITNLNGCSHIIPMDLNGDQHQDFVALFSQQHEMIVAYTSNGAGGFSEQKIFQARNPSFGSTRLKAIDLDQDGDQDLILINGDGLDASGPKPYHGIQWLEHKKKGEFHYREISRYYGVYDAAFGDLDGDGDMDMVASSQFNRWDDPKRYSLIWLENNGKESFQAHGIAHLPSHLGTVTLLDVNGDEKLDIVAGGMHIIPPFKPDHIGRLSLWLNRLPQKKP